MTDFEPEPVEDSAPKTRSIFDPPKRGPKDSAPKSEPVRRGRTSTHDKRKQKLLTVLATVGTAVAMFEMTDGQIIIANAEQVAEATATLADEVPAVAKALDSMSTGGAWGGFFLAIAAMIIPILAHHKLVPEFLTSAVIPPDQGYKVA
jgi:hypothetical protein